MLNIDESEAICEGAEHLVIVHPEGLGDFMRTPEGGVLQMPGDSLEGCANNARFFAHARAALPAALKELRPARELAEVVRQRLRSSGWAEAQRLDAEMQTQLRAYDAAVEEKP